MPTEGMPAWTLGLITRQVDVTLRSGIDPQTVLDHFSATLADFKADKVIAALQLPAGDRGQRLSDVLIQQSSPVAGKRHLSVAIPERQVMLCRQNIHNRHHIRPPYGRISKRTPRQSCVTDIQCSCQAVNS